MSKTDENRDRLLDKQESRLTASYSCSVLDPDRQIGHFKIECELDHGGMGFVYLAPDTRLGRPVAIRCLPSAAMRNPEIRSRLQWEACLLASINHPNIALDNQRHSVLKERIL